METVAPVLPILLFVVCVAAFALLLIAMGNLFGPRRSTPVKQMPYESGMDPIHDTRRRFDVRFHLLAIAFLVFDVELLFLYPWAVTAMPARVAAKANLAVETQTLDATQRATVDTLENSDSGQALIGSHRAVFVGMMLFVVLLALGFVYDWRKGIFEWR